MGEVVIGASLPWGSSREGKKGQVVGEGVEKELGWNQSRIKE